MGKIGLIARREFNERVRKKSFIITTIVTPLLMVLVIAVMVFMMTLSSSEDKEIIVVDRSGMVADKLVDENGLKFRDADVSLDSIRHARPEGVYGILVIGDDIMTNTRAADFYTYEASTMEIEESVAGQIQRILEGEKLKTYDIENLDTILAEIESPVKLQTKTISSSGDLKDSSSTLAMVSAYLFGLLIYMFVLTYGAMVMQGVIEEKSNKVLELIVSSVRPFELMMGKIIGIASVALTQLLIWVVFIIVVGGLLLNVVAGDMMEAAAAMNSGAGMPTGIDPDNIDTVAMLSKLTDLKYIMTLLGGFIVYFVGGYLFYASMFAAVGSAVDNEKDTQNLQLPITIPLILAFIVMFNALRDPTGPIAFWFSIIPFTSPIIMMARLPYGVPGWEVALSVVLLYASFVGMVWLAGKIYRVGIFMYGKKPTFSELFKWIKYKY